MLKIDMKTVDKVSPLWEKAQKELKKLDCAYSDIGIHKGAKSGDGEELVDRAVTNEFGFPEKKIPERSFMRKWFEKNLAKTKRLSKKNLVKVILGNFTAELAVEGLGLYAKKGIKKTITDLKRPPNAPYTIKKKGFDDPLIETKDMLNGIENRETIKK